MSLRTKITPVSKTIHRLLSESSLMSPHTHVQPNQPPNYCPQSTDNIMFRVSAWLLILHNWLFLVKFSFLKQQDWSSHAGHFKCQTESFHPLNCSTWSDNAFVARAICIQMINTHTCFRKMHALCYINLWRIEYDWMYCLSYTSHDPYIWQENSTLKRGIRTDFSVF